MSHTTRDIHHSLKNFLNDVTEWKMASYKNPSLLVTGSDAVGMDYYDGTMSHIDSMIHELRSQGLQGLYRIRSTVVAERNMHTSINKLPVEILREILEFCWDIPNTMCRPVHPAIVVSHVCTYWRAITLEHPAMWSRADVTLFSTAMIDLVHARLGSRLWDDLRCDLNFASRTVSDWAMPQVYQSKAMTIEMSPTRHSIPRILKIPSSDPLPLQRLVIRTAGEHSWGNKRVLKVPLFDGHAPHLKHLDLEMVRMPWDNGFYLNLSTLRIAKCPVGSHSNQDRDICCVLQDCPNLRSLELSLDDRNAPADGLLSAPYPRSQRIQLKSLHTLKLQLPIRYVYHILSAIVADSLSDLKLHLGLVTQREAHLFATLPLPGVLPTQILPALEAFQICLNGSSETTSLLGWKYPFTDTHHPSFILDWKTYFDPYPDYLRQMVVAIKENHTLPLLHVLELIINETIDVEDHPLAFFAQIPSLTTLRLAGTGATTALPKFTSLPPTVCAANTWAHLIHLGVYTVLTPTTSTALLQWCESLPALSLLNVSNSSFSSESTHDIDEIIRRFQALGIPIVWDTVQFWCQGDVLDVKQVWPKDLGYNFASV